MFHGASLLLLKLELFGGIFMLKFQRDLNNAILERRPDLVQVWVGLGSSQIPVEIYDI